MIAQASVVRKAYKSILLAAVFAAVGATSVQAQQSVADFYKGKQLKFIIRSAPGGGFDLYSRLLGTHMVRHLPGNPSLLAQNMPGAGGLQAVNYLGEVAARDGTFLTMTSQALPMDQALGYTPTFKADLRSFGWVGNVSDSNVLTYTWFTSPVKTMQDAKTRTVTLGGTGAGSATSWLPDLYNNLLGTKFKVINGYQGGSEVKLAMERGEVEGYAANPWAALAAASPELVKNKQLYILTQVGIAREKDLPDVPLLSELATDQDSKDILTWISTAMAVGRPIGTTPGVPPERLAALRKAFLDTIKDPVFLAAAEKAGAEIKPIDGVTLQAMVDKVMSSPQSLKDKVKAVMPDRGEPN